MMATRTTQFKGRQTSIPGLLAFDVTSIEDSRGWFQEKFHREKLVAAGLPAEFQVVQNSLSFNRTRGVTRGFHAEPWDKYISVVAGRVFVAFVDLREGDTFGKVETMELSHTDAIFLPEGVANSFQTLTDDTYYLYSVNHHWSADDVGHYAFVNLADPDIAIQWPIELTEATVSDRDRLHPPITGVIPLRTAKK
jgi:dTDP-4-dehydrorhamnose 3,5-epimerase